MDASRRSFLIGLLVLLAPPALAHPGHHRHPHVRRHRGRRRRVHRRRVRRRVVWRTNRGVRRLVVPVAVAPGWELVVDDRVVVVKQVHPDAIVVAHADGTTEKIPVRKQDTEENKQDLEGSEIVETVDEEVEEDPGA